MPHANAEVLPPLCLSPIFVERVWGTDSLGAWYPPAEQGKLIGEVWLTAEQCVVSGTNVALAEMAADNPAALQNVDGAGFPLLIKLLYPREKLSVQVHPNDSQARATLGQPRGKTECWYVLSAESGAEVAVGFRDSMTTEEVAQSIADGTIEAKMKMLPVKAGDLVFVEANTVHAIGPGMVVLEVQQYSDVTYRLWDYGRPRELHVDAGMAVTHTETNAGLVEPKAMQNFDRLVTCPYFTVDRFRLAAGARTALECVNELQILVALGENCHVEREGHEAVPLLPGHAVILPEQDEAYSLHALNDLEVIRVLGQKPTMSA